MPFEIVRNDIVNMQVDAIVNTANPRPVIGSGTDAGIHAKAGPQLLKARLKIGNIPVGCSEITPGYGLDAKYVIHTVGPAWRGGLFGEAKKLRLCYDSALNLALESGCQSIAFPLISTGNYGFPKDKALQIAIQAFSEFLMEHEMQIYLVVFNRDAFQLSEKLFHSVASYIDAHYVEIKEAEEYGKDIHQSYPAMRRREVEETPIPEECNYCAPMVSEPISTMPGKSAKKGFSFPVPKTKPSLAELLNQTDAGFSETLLKLIDRTGKKDSAIYSKANVSRQHFSKIRNNPNYKPTKATAVAFAIALELDLEQTKDLVGRAGYALTKSSKFDVIIMYFIEQRNYNMFDINAALFEFDQSLLGGSY